MAVVGLTRTTDARIGARFRYAAQVVAMVVVAIGVTVCCGWLLGVPALRQLHFALAPMKLNTAIALTLLGVALRCSLELPGDARSPATAHRDPSLIRVLAMISTAIAVATLIEHVLGIDLGIDELVCDDPSAIGRPGRMAPTAAVCLALIGIGVSRPDWRYTQWLAVAAALIAHIVLLGYLYGVRDLYVIGTFGSVAAHTAIALYLLAIGVVFARPDRGWMRIVTSESAGGVLARRLLPAAVVLPAVLALLRQWGEDAGYYGTGFGRALLVATNSVLFVALVSWTAAALSRADRNRLAAEAEVRAREAQEEHAALLAREALTRSNTRLRVLAEVSQAFTKIATSYQDLLDRVARTTADLVGDGCHVSLLTEDRLGLRDAACAHRDPRLEREVRTRLMDVVLPVATSPAIPAAVVRSGQPKRLDVHPADLVAGTDPALQQLVARLNSHGFAAVPIRARNEIVGALAVLRTAPGRSYTDEDLTLLQDLADRAGLAIDNARLYDQLEQRVRERTRQLETANKELEAFVYSIAHDLRSPLRGIAGFSRTVIDDHVDHLQPQGLEYLGRIEAGAQRMGRLIDDLLELARVSRAELRCRHVDVSELARAVVARLRAAHPDRDVEITVEDGLTAHADPRLLEVVLTNLLANAWKFTGKCAQARIEVAACTGASPTTFVVRDNGAGFDPKYAAKLFGVFERLHPVSEFEGTGIGLAISERIVDRHGGQIWAQSAPGEGATFFFSVEPRRHRATLH